jgi:amino acid transporter
LLISIQPLGGEPDAEVFFQGYIALPLILLLYAIWKGYSWFKYPSHRRMWVPIAEINVMEGIREEQLAISGEGVSADARRASITESHQEKKKSPLALAKRVFLLGG